MIEEVARHRCTASDGTSLVVIEQRHIFTTHGAAGVDRYRGAIRAVLADGEPVRHIDSRTFEIIATGERLRHDPAGCPCAPAPRVTINDAATAVP